VGQAKRRHVLCYLAARERAGIIGTGPFDLDEALVRLDARLAAGCRWALTVAVELALTRQLPKCELCRGQGRVSMGYDLAGERVAASVRCPTCEATGHNTHAQLPWPAWLRRKGQTMHRLQTRQGTNFGGWTSLRWGPIPSTWASPDFRAFCENRDPSTFERFGVDLRVETRARSFPRGAHESHDPWRMPSCCGGISPRWLTRSDHLPARLTGDERHAEQRRERADAKRVLVRGMTEGQLAFVEQSRQRRVGENPTLSLGDARSDFADALAYQVRGMVERYGLPENFIDWARDPERGEP
jgi:hypothetical protein